MYNQESAAPGILSERTAPNAVMGMTDQLNYKRFKIQNFTLELQDEEGPYWDQFIFNDPIPYDRQYQFQIEILKSPQRLVIIGVIDIIRKTQLCSHDSDSFAVCYQGNIPRVMPCGGFQGLGFREGQTVTVKINRKQGKIAWLVDGNDQAKHTHVMLKDETRILMPFVQMNQNNDIIRWKTKQ